MKRTNNEFQKTPDTENYYVRLYDLKKAILNNPYDPKIGEVSAYMRYLKYNTPAADVRENVRGEWISVKDRLPEAVEKDVHGKIAFSKMVLVYLCYEDGFTYITTDKCRVDQGLWLHEVPGEHCTVTHWMPLPDPPEEVSE